MIGGAARVSSYFDSRKGTELDAINAVAKLQLSMTYLKPIYLLLITGLMALGTGCVSTTYTKTISVTKDENGKVIQTIETESVTQPNQQGWPVKFEHLKGVQPFDSKPTAPAKAPKT
jgi:hypothetical protein